MKVVVIFDVTELGDNPLIVKEPKENIEIDLEDNVVLVSQSIIDNHQLNGEG